MKIKIIIIILNVPSWASLVAQMIKNLAAMRRPGFDPWFGKISWRTEWQPTPVFLPGELYGQRSLKGYNPWGPKKSDMTEQLSLHFIWETGWMASLLLQLRNVNWYPELVNRQFFFNQLVGD